MGVLTVYIVKRVLLVLPTLIGVITMIFFLVRILPGDPTHLLAGEQASPEIIERLKAEFGLDRPIYEQYILYLKSVLTLDFGTSYRTYTPVIVEIMSRFPNTVILALSAMLIAIFAGIALGIVSALRVGSVIDRAVIIFTSIYVSMPVFWLGLLLIYFFAVQLKILPAGGIGSPAHVILPSLALSHTPLSYIARITRESILETLSQEHVRLAIARGLPLRSILINHVIRNSLINVITVIGYFTGVLLGGAVVTETVFAWPGIGRLLIESIAARDYIMIQGIVIFIAMIFIFVNLIVDITYRIIDPRVRL
ncbi:ABC transporter permease [Desulfurococcaceae archaeon AG1]|jgi:peptide/nickel transport system permease protein/oligopeptide transport system permease protein|nr:MAG: peptide ABC transporter permease [Desulfurococcaceae archaeon]GAY26646.1 ABC transporter permease [Desulfurococcaceae archaeon AG1]